MYRNKTKNKNIFRLEKHFYLNVILKVLEKTHICTYYIKNVTQLQQFLHVSEVKKCFCSPRCTVMY